MSTTDDKVEALRGIFNENLRNPFPYRDTEKMESEYAAEFAKLEDYSLNADFNDYCMTIVGSISYVLNGTMFDIPQRQVRLLHYNFFERFPMYRFLESGVANYSEFNREYQSFEQARCLLGTCSTAIFVGLKHFSISTHSRISCWLLGANTSSNSVFIASFPGLCM